jgi:hypothetical protein
MGQALQHGGTAGGPPQPRRGARRPRPARPHHRRRPAPAGSSVGPTPSPSPRPAARRSFCPPHRPRIWRGAGRLRGRLGGGSPTTWPARRRTSRTREASPAPALKACAMRSPPSRPPRSSPAASHAALLAPARRRRAATVDEPDRGQRPTSSSRYRHDADLADRCHDATARRCSRRSSDRSFVARTTAPRPSRAPSRAAVLTSRRRVWGAVRRSGPRACRGPAPTCRRRAVGDRTRRRGVMALCLDAACALLVADALPDATPRSLTDPCASSRCSAVPARPPEQARRRSGVDDPVGGHPVRCARSQPRCCQSS